MFYYRLFKMMGTSQVQDWEQKKNSDEKLGDNLLSSKQEACREDQDGTISF